MVHTNIQFICIDVVLYKVCISLTHKFLGRDILTNEVNLMIYDLIG